MDNVPEEIMSLYNNLVGIRNKLENMKSSQCKHTMDDIRKYQQMLDALDQKRDSLGIFSGNMQAPGQAPCMEVMDDAYDILEELISTASDLNGEMDHLYKTLKGIERTLNHMKQQKCSMEDLRHYQQMLDAIDSKRVDGIFAGSKTNIPSGQGLCSEILATCYELVEELKPVAQYLNADMQRVFKSLLKIKEELLEMDGGKVEHLLSHLHPYQVKLDEIDKAREEGIFYGSLRSGNIPAGQAVCADLLDECYQLVRKLQASSFDYGSDKTA